MKGDKQTLLKKNGKNQYAPIKEEWIQMEDLRAPEHEIAYKKLEEENPYPSLKQSSLKPGTVQQDARSRPVPPARNQPQPQPQPQKIPPPQNIYPSQSISGSRPNTITLNGTTFKQKSSEEQTMKKTKIPLMEVACQFCTIMQKVPGNTQVYICGTCQNMNECYPLYGIFICGCCQRNVCYAFGTSEFIKCTRCGTINKVPFQPQKKYQAQKKEERPRMQRQSNPNSNQNPMPNQYTRQVQTEKREQPAKLQQEELILSQLEQLSEKKSEFTEKDFKYDDI